MNVFTYFSAFILSCFLHFSFYRIFVHFKKFDDINHRSSHKAFATRTGGIGVFITLFLVSVYYYFQSIDLFNYSLFIPLGIMFIVGVYDDFYQANFKLKFLFQIIVGKILIDQGFVINNFQGFLGVYEIPWLMAQITTIIMFLIIINSINFIDGIDGLAISEVIKIIFFYELFKSNDTLLNTNFNYLFVISILPLFYFNFKKKSKVFLGDGGSLLLGTYIAILFFSIFKDEYSLNGSYKLNKFLLGILMIMYPFLDLIRVSLHRILKGRSPFMADNNHFHHFFIKKGITHSKSVLIIQLISCIIFFSSIYLIKLFGFA